MKYPFNSISDIRLLDSSQSERVRYLGQLKDKIRADAAPHKCKVGKPCAGRCIPQEHTCGGAVHNSIMMTYHHIGGDDYAHELTQQNKKMDKEHAQMYVREAAKSLLTSMNDHEAGQKELDQVNKKYASHFGN